MNPAESEVVHLLRELRDAQRLQMERQADALALQREQFEMARHQFDRAERINAKAEAIQERSAGVIGAARKLLWIVVPLLLVLLAIMTYRILPWLMN